MKQPPVIEAATLKAGTDYICNRNGIDDKSSLAQRRKLSAYVRGIKESSLAAFNYSSSNGKRTTGQGVASDQDKAGINTAAAAAEGAPAVQGSERRESAVTLAAKRVALRKRKEKAEEDARIRVKNKAIAQRHAARRYPTERNNDSLGKRLNPDGASSPPRDTAHRRCNPLD